PASPIRRMGLRHETPLGHTAFTHQKPKPGGDVWIVDVDIERLAGSRKAIAQGVAVHAQVTRGLCPLPMVAQVGGYCCDEVLVLISRKSSSLAMISRASPSGNSSSSSSPRESPCNRSANRDRVVPMSSNRTSSETTADALGSDFDSDRRRSVSRGCPEGSRYHDSARVIATASTSAHHDLTTRTTFSLSRACTRRTR